MPRARQAASSSRCSSPTVMIRPLRALQLSSSSRGFPSSPSMMETVCRRRRTACPRCCEESSERASSTSTGPLLAGRQRCTASAHSRPMGPAPITTTPLCGSRGELLAGAALEAAAELEPNAGDALAGLTAGKALAAASTPEPAEGALNSSEARTASMTNADQHSRRANTARNTSHTSRRDGEKTE